MSPHPGECLDLRETLLRHNGTSTSLSESKDLPSGQVRCTDTALSGSRPPLFRRFSRRCSCLVRLSVKCFYFARPGFRRRSNVLVLGDTTRARFATTKKRENASFLMPYHCAAQSCDPQRAARARFASYTSTARRAKALKGLSINAESSVHIVTIP